LKISFISSSGTVRRLETSVQFQNDPTAQLAACQAVLLSIGIANTTCAIGSIGADNPAIVPTSFPVVFNISVSPELMNGLSDTAIENLFAGNLQTAITSGGFTAFYESLTGIELFVNIDVPVNGEYAPSLQPSFAPSLQPSSAPSLQPSSGAPAHGNCVDVALLDEFGDGWQGLSLVVSRERDPTFQRVEYSANCFHSLYFQFCPFESGVYAFEMQKVTDFVFSWEARYFVQFEVFNVPQMYVGDMKTKLKVGFNNATQSFFNPQIDFGVFPHACKQCVTDDAPKIRTPVAKPPPAAKPPPVTFRTTMMMADPNVGGWFNESAVFNGHVFRFSDANGTQLLSSGTLCGHTGFNGCTVSFHDGSYRLRVGGSPSVGMSHAWRFCNTTGTAFTELFFEIRHNQCEVTLVQSLKATCVSSHIGKNSVNTVVSATTGLTKSVVVNAWKGVTFETVLVFWLPCFLVTTTVLTRVFRYHHQSQNFEALLQDSAHINDML